MAHLLKTAQNDLGPTGRIGPLYLGLGRTSGTVKRLLGCWPRVDRVLCFAVSLGDACNPLLNNTLSALLLRPR